MQSPANRDQRGFGAQGGSAGNIGSWATEAGNTDNVVMSGVENIKTTAARDH